MTKNASPDVLGGMTLPHFPQSPIITAYDRKAFTLAIHLSCLHAKMAQKASRRTANHERREHDRLKHDALHVAYLRLASDIARLLDEWETS